jgi:RNA polymerase sigma factor (sigma-70 family)
VIDPDKARLVELRYFGGLSIAEVAEILDTSPSTVERSWRAARAWLRAALEDDLSGA